MGTLTEGANQFAIHVRFVSDALRGGRVVPFLGAGVNLCDRPRGVTWQPEDKTFLPSGAELARYLAGKFFYPGGEKCVLAEIAEIAQKGGKGETGLPAEKDPKAVKEGHCLRPDPDLDLLRVSQFSATMLEQGPIYDELHTLFGGDFPPTSAHLFLARLPQSKPDPSGAEDRHLLVVTTNYDDLMERALGEGNYDLVFYVPDDQPRARGQDSKGVGRGNGEGIADLVRPQCRS
jgi:hypothetical protein